MQPPGFDGFALAPDPDGAERLADGVLSTLETGRPALVVEGALLPNVCCTGHGSGCSNDRRFDMTRVLVAYGSRHGATRGIAKRIGQVLGFEGIESVVESADRIGIIEDVDAFLVGSGVYMGSWLKEPLEFLDREQHLLASRPTWFFSSGPLKGSSKEDPAKDLLESALGPAEGPGSGGRRRIAELEVAIGIRDHRVFYGAFDPTDPPRAMSERFVRMMPGSKGILPPGDFRDWERVDAWAREIAAALKPAPVGAGT